MNFPSKSKIIAFIMLVLVSIFSANAQEVVGSVLDLYGPIAGVNVFAKGTTIGTQTNVNGNYKLSLPKGDHILVVSYTGYSTQEKKITLTKNEVLTENFTLKIQTNSLKNVEVFAKTEAQLLRETSYAIEVIEAEQFKNLTTNGNEILAKVPGVNIRQSGGLGSNFKLSLNGLTDNQVRVFIDGIPMHYFGTSLSLNNFSANLIEQIEVYKGVVPIHLSSDALGGAINVVTNKSNKSFLDASYSLGSFNTHIASVNGQYRNESSGFTAKFKSFYNYSDNNYDIDVVLNNEIETTNVERFHDAYESKMGWFEAGYTDVKFADQLMLGLLYSDNYNEIQQGEFVIGNSAEPYGGVITKEEKLISNLHYSKNDFITKNLGVNSYFAYVLSEEKYEDLGGYNYTWFGTRTVNTANVGEIEGRKTDLTLNTDNILSNVNVEYAITENHNVAVNYSLNYAKIKGFDSLNAENLTRFANPNKLTSQVTAISYTNSLFEKKFESSVFLKFFNFKNNSIETNYQGTEEIEINENSDFLGYGFSTSYKIGLFQIKASFENALRFPEIYESFGDGFSIEANPFLKPETSKNYNIGFLFNNRNPKHSINLSTNGFVRDTEDFINDVIIGNTVQYQNNQNFLTKGIDFSASYQFEQKLLFNIAATFVDIRDNSRWINGIEGRTNIFYKERKPNQPYFFGNATISYTLLNLLKDEDSLSLNINENYTHEFFYTWAIVGSLSDKEVIPSQLSTDLEFVYSFKKQTYNISFGIINLFDGDLYDNLYQQRPGRSFNIKLRYFIN